MDIRDFKDKHKGERCFILGNGPSLKEVDFDLLKGEVTFGTNRIYLSGHTPTYYCAVNPLVIKQFRKEILEIDAIKFFPDAGVYVTVNLNRQDLCFIDTSERVPSFGSPEGPIWEGYTVTYVCLQLAYYMGFTEVILLGVDHDYGKEYQPNQELTAAGDDVGHFHPEYFSGGVKWNAPDLERSELAYNLAKEAYEDDNRRIINCSAHTKLEVFRKAPLNYCLNMGPRVSAIVSAYKSEEFLKGLFTDLLAQQGGLEIVVVCQKDSKEHGIAFDWQSHYKSAIEIVTTPDIPTVYKAWNLGIKAAHGKYITNANTDDRHHPRAYEIMANVLDARPDIDLVYHDAYITWKPNQSYQEFDLEDHEQLVGGRYEGEPGVFLWGSYSRSRLGKGCFIGPQPMWRASLHQKYGYFREEYVTAGDYEFWLRISKDENIFHIPYPLGLYCARTDGIELSHPEENYDESFRAVVYNQEPQIEIHAFGQDHVRLDLGGRWFITTRAEFDQWKDKV